jgi:RNA polymerase sigma-70 factor (ECF subfamily)
MRSEHPKKGSGPEYDKTPEQNDLEWIKRLRSGNEMALKHFYDEHHAGIYFYTLKLLKQDVGEAEDITAKAFSKLWDNRRKMKDPVHLVNWLYQVSRNAVIDHLKKKNRRASGGSEANQETIDESPHEMERARAEVMEQLYKEIAGLPPREREVFDLLCIQKRSGKEVAVLLGISESSVSRYKERILAQLRTEMLKKGLQG